MWMLLGELTTDKASGRLTATCRHGQSVGQGFEPCQKRAFVLAHGQRFRCRCLKAIATHAHYATMRRAHRDGCTLHGTPARAGP